MFQAITDEIVRRSAHASEQRGQAISCRAGCGACCRQLVPISETEAHLLAELVDASPEPRRDVLRARFADARRRLEAAGIWERLLAHRSLSEDDLERLGLDYFRAGVACPFLEDELVLHSTPTGPSRAASSWSRRRRSTARTPPPRRLSRSPLAIR